MLRRILVKYTFPFVMLVIAFVSPFSDFIKRLIIDQYDLRYYVGTDLRPGKKTEMIAVHNAGDINIPKIFVGVSITPDSGGVVSDFDFAPLDSDPRKSILGAITGPDLLKIFNPSDQKILAPIFIGGSNTRTLYDIDRILEEIITAELQRIKVPKNVMRLLQQVDSPYLWSQKCRQSGVPESICKFIEEKVMAYAKLKHDLRSGAYGKWQGMTSVELIAEGNSLCPTRSMYFSFPLGKSESAFLQVRYGSEAAQTDIKVLSAIPKNLIKVDDKEDLQANSLWISCKYYTVTTLACAFLILVFGVLTWHSVRPISRIPTYKIFNRALETEDQKYWTEAYNKHIHHICFEYDEKVSKNGGTKPDVGPDKLFGRIRREMEVEKKKQGSLRFVDDFDLNRFIGKALDKAPYSTRLDGVTMTVEDSFDTLRKDPLNDAAWQVVAYNVHQSLLAYVAPLLVTFRVAPGETAHDIVQEVILRLFERWPEIRHNIVSLSDLRAYLRTSCRNLLVDRFRRERKAEQVVDFLGLKFSQAFQDESGLYKSIFIDEIIRKLPMKCAELFRQYVNEDLSPAEIADRLGEPPATFYSRWYRCIQTAKQIFNAKKV